VDIPVNYLTTPAAIVNEAVDMIGESGQIIGAITDGTQVSETARRNYGQALRRLLRTSYWNFARKKAKLQLLGDALAGTAIPPGVSPYVEAPWAYAYATPPDCVMARWVPWSPTNAQPTDSNGVPLTTGTSALVFYDQQPASFLISSSDQYPIEVGSPPWTQLPDLQRTFGLGPQDREILLTNVCDAHLVYTAFIPTIERWDSLFRQALVSMMALAIVNVAIKDPKYRLAERDRISASLKITIDDARVASGRESGYPQSVDHTPVWISARSGAWWGATPGYGGSLYSGYPLFPLDGSLQWQGSVY
jgi:hypothetical protein